MRSLNRRWSMLGVLALITASSHAHADLLDLTLHRLIPRTGSGGGPDPEAASARADYRQLSSELGVILAPRILSPADTLGYSGFQVTFDAGFSTLSNSTCRQNPANPADLDSNQCPWQRGAAGKDGPNRGLPRWAQTLSVTARKGFWLPVPGFEIGVGATKLLQSNIYALQAYVKVGLHEGYHRFGLPSIAVRGSAARVFGTPQLSLTLVQSDIELSKNFGVRGTVTLTPYLGAAGLLVIGRSQVIDTTPGVDAYEQGPNSLDLNNNVVFANQDNILRWRFFGGLRLQYSVLVLTGEFLFTACGDLGVGRCNHAGKDVPDRSPHQYTVNVSGGFAF
jgi:hypothetical protein